VELTSIPQYVMAWCSVKTQGQLYFYLILLVIARFSRRFALSLPLQTFSRTLKSRSSGLWRRAVLW